MKITFVLLLSLITLSLSAQEAGKAAVIAVTNLNVLYTGVSNPVEIAVPGITSERVTATAVNGTIKKTSSGYEIVPLSLEDVVVTVLVDNKGVTEKRFRVKKLPVPVAVLGGISNGVISRNDINKTVDLKAEMKDFLWDLTFEIKSFTFLFSKDGNDKEIVAQSNILTEEMKKNIADLERGKYIIFKDIKAVGPDGIVRDLSPLILKVD